MLHTTLKHNFLTIGFIAKTAGEGKYDMVFHCGNHCEPLIKLKPHTNLRTRRKSAKRVHCKMENPQQRLPRRVEGHHPMDTGIRGLSG